MSTVTTISSAQARRLADKWLETVSALKELETQKARIENELRDYVRETGEQTISNVMAYERSKPPKLECADRDIKNVMPQLVARLPEDYVKITADVAAIVRDFELVPGLRKICNKLNVAPAEQEKEIYFKHIS
jgi:hypothetical protein